MSIKTEILTGRDSGQMKTEIMFFIAAAKSVGRELFKLEVNPVFSEEREVRRVESIARILRNLKQRGIIQLFASSSDFNTSITEIEYLRNKYPNITEIEEDGMFFVVKL